MAPARAGRWLFSFRGRVGRNQYWLAGVLLFAFKLGLDALLALPFLWMGTSLTVRRLRDASLSPMWVALFVLSIVNVVFFVLLACMPGGQGRIAAAVAEERGGACSNT